MQAGEALSGIKGLEDVPAAMQKLAGMGPDAARAAQLIIDAMYKREIDTYTKQQGLSKEQFGKLMVSLESLVTAALWKDPDALRAFAKAWQHEIETIVLGCRRE